MTTLYNKLYNILHIELSDINLPMLSECSHPNKVSIIDYYTSTGRRKLQWKLWSIFVMHAELHVSNIKTN